MQLPPVSIKLTGEELRLILEERMALGQDANVTIPVGVGSVHRTYVYADMYSAEGFLKLFHISLEDFYNQYDLFYKDTSFELLLTWYSDKS